MGERVTSMVPLRVERCERPEHDDALAPATHALTLHRTTAPDRAMSDERPLTIERDWVEAIRGGDERAFEAMFHAHYRDLCVYAASYVSSFDSARDVVQDVFLRIWKRRENWTVRVSLKAYLYRAVRNQSLNYLKQENDRRKKETGLDGAARLSVRSGEDGLLTNELLAAYRKAVSALPERRRTAFVLNRQHGFSYAEIALVMDISERTVETHIAKALASLKRSLYAVGWND